MISLMKKGAVYFGLCLFSVNLTIVMLNSKNKHTRGFIKIVQTQLSCV